MPNLSMTSVPFVTAFSPTSVESLALWLDGTDPAGTGTAPSAGATVSTWVDKSTSAKNATAGGTPTYVSGGGINFNGSSWFSNTSFSQNLSQRSIFIVMQETTRTAVGGVFPLIPTPSSGNDYDSTGLSVETQNGLRFYNGAGYQSDIGNASLLVKAVYNDNMNVRAGTGFINGNAATTVTASYTGGTSSGYGIGARWLGGINLTYSLRGVIFEIMYFNSPLGTTDRRNIEGYLAQKWGVTAELPVGHPGLSQTFFSATPALRSLGGLTSTLIITSIPYYTTFNPINLGNLALWLDASQDTTANGVSIASLVDRSGNGNSLTPSGTITAATQFLGEKTVYNFGSSRASKTNFPWQTSFTQIVLVKCATGNWLSSLVSGGAYLAYIFAGNENLINVNNFFDPRDSSVALATSVFTTAADGVSSWVILSLGYQSGATSASNYTINGTVRTTATSTAVSSAISGTNQLWLNGNGSFNFDTGTYVAEMMHYNAVLSGTERQQIESYLAQKWGLLPVLPVGHLQDTAPAGMPTSILTKSLTNKQEIILYGSVQLSGANYLSTAGNAGTAMGTGDFTWECFVYPTSSTSYQAFIDTRTNPLSGGDTTGFYFGTNTGTLTPMFYTNGLQLASSVNITLNAWNHVALTRASGTVTIWVNGASGGTKSDTTNLTQQRVFIGSGGAGLYLTGNITNLRIVKGTSVYTGTFSRPTTPVQAITGTQLLLNFATTETLLTDSSTNNFTITNTGTATWNALTPF